MKNITFNDVMNFAAGELLVNMGGIDRLMQSIQLAIVMIGSNPF
jgi:hypothetical protein